MQAPAQPVPPVDPPNGLHSAKTDDKGRLKLPGVFLAYLAALQVKELFVTTVDKTTAKLYTKPVWNESKKRLLAVTGENRQAARDVLFQANLMGEDSEIDPQGRVLLPTNMRRLLKLEGSTVWLDAGEGVLNVYSQEMFQARVESVNENYEEKLASVVDLLS